MKKFFKTPGRAVIAAVCITAIVILGTVIIFATAFFAGFSYRGKEITQVKLNEATQDREKEVVLEDAANQDSQNTVHVEYDTDTVYGDEQKNIDETTETDIGVENIDETTETDIGVDKARAIAAGHAGFSVSEVNFSKTKLEKDHGKMIYEIEFYKDTMEYEYEIDAVTGEIIEFDSEWDR